MRGTPEYRKEDTEMEKKQQKRKLCLAACLLAAFVLWTLLVALLDVAEIGPCGTRIGMATLNRTLRDALGVCMPLYTLTDRLGLVPAATALGFAVLGLCEWIRRRDIRRVDRSILLLGAFYITLAAVYILFEELALNYRPVLIAGRLEVSYPSSTTLLVGCIMPTAWIAWRTHIKSRVLRRCAGAALAAFVAFMLLGRILSGVHWITDIIGGILFSAAFVLAYAALAAPQRE